MKSVKAITGIILAVTLFLLEAGAPVYAQETDDGVAVAQEMLTEDTGNGYTEQEADEAVRDEPVDIGAADSDIENITDENADAVYDRNEGEKENPDSDEETESASGKGVQQETAYSAEPANAIQRETKLSLAIEYPNDIKCGVPVTFTMKASGGTGQYKYRIAALIRQEGSELVSVYDVSYGNNSSYSTNNTFTFTFYASGTYYLRFSAMDMGSKPYQTVSTGLFEYPVTIRDVTHPSVEEIVENVSAQCLKECSTEFEKALWLHDWIIDHAEYDNTYSYCSAEGVLARGTGTCESYHRAYVMLLNKVGIQTGRITGNGHVWTAVKMDGKWYQVDSTWDDMGEKLKGTYYEHIYFGLTDYITGLVHSDHKSSVAGYESTSLENNYFIRTGKIEQWSGQFADPIKKQLEQGNEEFTLSVTDSMPDNYKNVIYNLVAYQLSAQDWNGKKIAVSYTNNALIVKSDNSNDELLSLGIVPPSKKIYEKGEAVDTTGLKITAVYLGGTKIKVLDSNEYRIEGFNTNTVGNHTATVTYGGKSASFTYTVKEKQDSGNGNTGGNTGGSTGGNTGGGTEVPVQPEKPKAVQVSYRTHVQSFGWQKFVANGVMSGTSGKAKRLEGIEIKLATEADLGIQYTTHCQTYGWLPWSSDGGMNGTTGESKRLEAIKIQLTGADKDKYDIYYRVHAQTYGWLNWAKNGESAGTAGYAKRLEGIQIVIVQKGGSFDRNIQGISSKDSRRYVAASGGEPTVGGADSVNTMYRTHVQSFGWQGWKYNGQMSGTSGKSKRLEGIELQLTNQQYDGGIRYRTHIQSIGWQGWKENGAMSGTSGQAKRLEAIEIQLTGTMEKKYDVYYRVHAQKFGWMDWAKNGEPAGTAGYAYRLEGIEIKLVPKGSAAPGSTVRPFAQR